MEWLTQNWLPLLLIVGVGLLLLTRRRGPAGHSMHHHQPIDAAPVDPVSGQRVSADAAVTCVYRGRTYYFASRENRDRFEAAPDQFGGGAQPAQDERSHRHGGHGCC